MSIKPDRWIRRMAVEQRMIEPFVEGQISEGAISYGLSSFGYDIRVADEFRIFTAGDQELTPNPEPGTIVLFGSVLAGAFYWRRRRAARA